MLKQRIITAVILAPLVIAGIFLLPFPAFIAALAAITLLGFWEWTQFVETKSRLAAMALPAAAMLVSLAVMPTDVEALSALASSHQAMLLIVAAYGGLLLRRWRSATRVVPSSGHQPLL